MVGGFGRFGMEGKGSNFGKFGGVLVVCNRWRAAWLPLMLLRVMKAPRKNIKKKKLRKVAMARKELIIR